MTRPAHLPLRSLLLMCCLAAAYPAAAQVTSSSTTTDSTTTGTTTTTAVGSSATTEAKLSMEFADFLGGQEQAGTVVSGLRQGTAFDLVTETTTTGSTGTTGTPSTTTTTTTTTIDPPTGTMGYGNIRITLRLAQAELNQLGITQPTPDQLSAVLLGGELNGTQTSGILALRAEGMGWGQIAKEYGFTVGQLMGNGAGVTKQPAATTTTAQTQATTRTSTAKTTAASSGQGSAARANGYIPSSSAKVTPTARANGYIPSGKSQGAMVSAGGASLGSAQGGGKGSAHKVDAGAASGAAGGANHHVSAAGAGNGAGANALAPGQVKKN